MTDEGFEAFHVPQQSRRDKLRVVVVQSTHHHYNYPHAHTTTTTNTSNYQQQEEEEDEDDDQAYNQPDHHHRFLPTAALYDPSESDDAVDLLPTTHCPANPLAVEDHLHLHHHHHDANFKFQQAIPLVSLSTPSSSSPCLAVVKEEEDLGLGVNLMPGFGNGVGGGGGGGRSLIINPSCSSVQDMNNLIHTTNNPYDLYTASSIDNLRNYFNHHQQQQQQQQSFNIDHRDQVAMAATTTTLFKPQTLNNSNNFSYEPRTNILQAGGGGGGGGGGLSLSLSSSSHPQNNNNNNSHRADAAQELNNLVSPPQRYHDQSSMMFGGDKSIGGGGYLFRGEGGGGAGGSASVLTSNDCRSSKGGISSTSSRVSSPNLEGPFTGYTSILKESRFLKPAQLLLEENCDILTNEGMYHRDHVDDHTTVMSEGGGKDSSLMSNLMDTSQHQMMLEKLSESGRTNSNGVIGGGSNGGGNRHTSTSSSEQNRQTSKKTTRLISMLDEVYRRYKHYYQQMVATVTSFESVAGLGNAAPYTSFALQAMSKHFRCLKNAITDQLYFTNKDYSVERSLKKDEYPRFGKTDPHIHSQRSVHDAAFLERQHVWRPQRGLPEHAVAVLRAWLFEHFLHPYPTDNDKQMLAKQTGLSRSQVSNWFINARVRLWKPMVEEIHMLETRQTEKGSEVEDQNIIKLNEPLSTAATNPLPSDHQQPQSNPTLQQVHNPPLKRSRNELPPLVPNKSSNDQMMNFSYNNLSSYQQHVSLGGISSNTGANSGVSLTLGLRQNNGTGLSGAASTFPLNVARRFGIEADNEGYVIGSGFEASNNRMNYGKDIGGQLLHDFVG